MTKASWYLLTPEQQANFGNGCGPGSFEEWVPDFCWSGLCRKHDFNYRIRGNPLTKMYYDTVLLKDMLVRLFTSKVKWLLFSPLLIPVAFAYWAFLILTTPRYMVSTYMKTGFKARTMEEMAAIYHFDFHPGDSSSDGTADG